ncbi:glycoside hydrolase [Corynespora cassiicola Philippines]|uniref:chitinase n=1 Tax=Corynespora cassiicola Philippines TaxID=1448308 RepID=A0A2T2PB01_CORCC|nr:glycoside hydrolase [Corynespora cassiicola Philippines]
MFSARSSFLSLALASFGALATHLLADIRTDSLLHVEAPSLKMAVLSDLPLAQHQRDEISKGGTRRSTDHDAVAAGDSNDSNTTLNIGNDQSNPVSISPLSSNQKLLPRDSGPRFVVYAQTFHGPDGVYHSLRPLITRNTLVTHVIVGAIHINEGPGNISLNEHLPSDSRFDELWDDVKYLQSHGVKVLGMLGGAAMGSYWRLTAPEHVFEAYYAPLKEEIAKMGLDGIDIDIEEPVPIETATHLISKLRSDFGPNFLITMAPTASALLPDLTMSSHSHPPMIKEEYLPNPLMKTQLHFSGFSYFELEASTFGKEIAWYNTQFYCGWGDLNTTESYDMIVSAGWKPERVVLGVVTNPENACGDGHVSIEKLKDIASQLMEKYEAISDGFGGISGWEFFNSGAYDKEFLPDSGPELDNQIVQTGWLKALGHILTAESPFDSHLV